jgi:predicted small metal-binding protein
MTKYFSSQPLARARFQRTTKTMTCKSLGAHCEQELAAGSWDEMVRTMAKHVMEKHPGYREGNGEDASTRPQEMGPGNEARVGFYARQLTA